MIGRYSNLAMGSAHIQDIAWFCIAFATASATAGIGWLGLRALPLWIGRVWREGLRVTSYLAWLTFMTGSFILAIGLPVLTQHEALPRHLLWTRQIPWLLGISVIGFIGFATLEVLSWWLGRYLREVFKRKFVFHLSWTLLLFGVLTLQVSPLLSPDNSGASASLQSPERANIPSPRFGTAQSENSAQRQQAALNLPPPGEPTIPGEALSWGGSLAILGSLIGAGLLIVGALIRNRLLQGVGVASLAWGTFSHWSLVNGIKIGDLIRAENPELLTIEKGQVNVDLSENHSDSTTISGPQHLVTIAHFIPGDARINADMSAEIKSKVCPAFKDHHDAKNEQGIVTVIGGTDIIPLNSSTRDRFGSNFGLAEARAKNAREQLLKCEVRPASILTLSAGPHNFSEGPSSRSGARGNAEDRRVEFWVNWVPVRGAVPQQLGSSKRRSGGFGLDRLTFFGLLAGTTMVFFYILENERKPILSLLFGVACLLVAVYGVVSGSPVLAALEVIWCFFAVRKWLRGRKRLQPMGADPAMAAYP
jgi:flagellar motor protein MotB